MLISCCGADRWVTAMLARRPFGTIERLLRGSQECWALLKTEDLLEALEAHPRIGGDVLGSRWSAVEQAKVGECRAARQQLVAANRAYERRFRFRFVVFAEGKSADLILDQMRRRLCNDRGDELLLAADQAAQITRSRLQKLVGP